MKTENRFPDGEDRSVAAIAPPSPLFLRSVPADRESREESLPDLASTLSAGHSALPRKCRIGHVFRCALCNYVFSHLFYSVINASLQEEAGNGNQSYVNNGRMESPGPSGGGGGGGREGTGVEWPRTDDDHWSAGAETRFSGNETPTSALAALQSRRPSRSHLMFLFTFHIAESPSAASGRSRPSVRVVFVVASLRQHGGKSRPVWNGPRPRKIAKIALSDALRRIADFIRRCRKLFALIDGSSREFADYFYTFRNRCNERYPQLIFAPGIRDVDSAISTMLVRVSIILLIDLFPLFNDLKLSVSFHVCKEMCVCVGRNNSSHL